MITKRDAVKILMLSPFYFRLSLLDRKLLLDRFCHHHGQREN